MSVLIHCRIGSMGTRAELGKPELSKYAARARGLVASGPQVPAPFARAWYA